MPIMPGRRGQARDHARRSPAIAALLLVAALSAVSTALADEIPRPGTPASPLTPPAGDPPRDLRELLALVDGNLPLRLTLASRDEVVGHPWRIQDGHLQVVPATAFRQGQAPRAGELVSVPVADIVRVEQSRSGARAGAGWGAKTGAIVVGGLGLLVGAAVAGLSEGDDDAAPVLGFGIVGVGAGALVGGGIGAGVGALGRDWVTLWPPDEAGEPSSGDVAGGQPARRARFALEAGWSVDDRAEVDGRGPGARIGLVRRLGGAIEMGPFAEFHDLHGATLYEYQYDPAYPPYDPLLVARNRMFSLGLDVRANGQARGVRFMGTAGIGWCLSDELYIGANAGLGLRRRGEGGHEVSLLVRRHFEVTGMESRQGRFWSVAAGITFGD